MLTLVDFILTCAMGLGFLALMVIGLHALGRPSAVTRQNCEWKGRLQQRWRWSTWRKEWGRYCYIVHPVEDGRDIVWWEWEVSS